MIEAIFGYDAQSSIFLDKLADEVSKNSHSNSHKGFMHVTPHSSIMDINFPLQCEIWFFSPNLLSLWRLRREINSLFRPMCGRATRITRNSRGKFAQARRKS